MIIIIQFFITGAGHVHGTLWVDLGSIERPVRMKKGKLVSPEKTGKIEGLCSIQKDQEFRKAH